MYVSLSEAADRVNDYIDNDGRGLAMFKVSIETGYSTKELAGEFTKRRKMAKKKCDYKKTLPDYVLSGKDWD